MEPTVLLPLLKIAGMFALIILLLRLSSQIGLALAVGAAALGLLFSLNPIEILYVFGSALTDSQTLLVILIVTLILILSTSMEKSGQLEELLRRFKGWAGRTRWAIVAFPALIGLLPMPGGAVFSAPMLDSFDPEKSLSPSLKSFLNYWFRHVWEYWWPLYPAVILACAIAGIDLWKYMLLALPMSVVAVAGGLPQLMQVPEFAPAPGTKPTEKGDQPAWVPLLPLLLAILPGVSFGLVLQFLPTGSLLSAIPKETGLVIGLVVGIVWIWWRGRIGTPEVRAIVLGPKLWRMLLTLAGVFVFKGIMESSGAAHQVAHALIQLEIPLEWMVVLIPMTLGVITGLPIAVVGAAFPVVANLISAMGASDMTLPLVILALGHDASLGHPGIRIGVCWRGPVPPPSLPDSEQ
jgi:integral membrane protein (TIGR00529 family)